MSRRTVKISHFLQYGRGVCETFLFIRGSAIWKRLISLFPLVVFSVVPSLSQSGRTGQNTEPGVVLVQYEHDAYPGGVEIPLMLEIQSMEPAFPLLSSVAGKGSQLASVRTLRQMYRVTYGADITPRQAARMIMNSPDVKFAEPIYRRTAFRSSSRIKAGQSPVTPGHHRRPIPNDPLFSDEAYMQRMEVTKAWDFQKGEDRGIVIAVVDYSIDWNHPDLLANIWENSGEIADNGVDDDDNGFVDDVHGWNFSDKTNDPRPSPGEDDDHGTLVAGVATAVANNGVGMAGTSWNAKLMPIKTSCSDDPEEICFGNEGVLYAAMNGAHIINISWGDVQFSEAEKSVMQAAQDLGSLVVAATPNEHTEMGIYNWDYPSSLLSTLSVCGTERDSYQNRDFAFGYTVDVCAAAVDVQATAMNGEYHLVYGTSFATPLVSGIAALVKARFPEFTPQQVREQIRVAADHEIYRAHPPTYEGLFGRGYVNAYRAVTETDRVSIRMIEWEATDENNDLRFSPSEEIHIAAIFKSFLADAEALSVEFVSKSPYVIFPSGNTANIGPLQSGMEARLDFSMVPASDVPYKSIIFIEPRIRTSDGLVVSGSDVVRLIVNDVQLALHENAAFSYTMTSEGNIGYTDFGWSEDTDYPGATGQMDLVLPDGTIGFIHEAGLLIGRGPSSVAGSVFEVPEGTFQNQDFVPVTPIEFLEDRGEQRSRVTLKDETGKLPEGLEVIQESLTDAQSQFEDIALFRYRLRNHSNATMVGLHVGLFFSPQLDVDEAVGMASYQNGNVKEIFPYWDLNEEKGYREGYIGFLVLSDEAEKHYKLYTGDEEYDLYEPEDAWSGLSGGIQERTGTSSGNASLMASGPYVIGVSSEVAIDFAMIYGESQRDLIENAQRAFQLKDNWDDFPAATLQNESLPKEFMVVGNYPNPLSDRTKIEFDLPESAQVFITIYDLLGRTVRALQFGRFGAGRGHTVEIVADELTSGVYYYTLTADMNDKVIERSKAMTVVR